MHGEYKMPGGKLVVIDLDVRDGRLADVQLSGDFFLEPDSALDTINRALEGLSEHADETALAAAVRNALAVDVMMYGLSPEAVAVAVRRALHKEPAA
jgi:lipoate-protein ligase A